MDPLTSFGLAVVAAFQSMAAVLDAPMSLFSFLGSEEFYLVFLPLVYWSIDARLGIRIAFILVPTTALNLLFKLALHAPRPYWVSADVRGLASEPSFGVPSFHAQVSAGVWGMIAAYLRRRGVWITALVLVLLIGISRLHLGVHFPQDVLVGWALGFFVLWAVLRLWVPAEERLKRMATAGQVGLAFAASIVIILVGVAILYLFRDFQMPAQWIANATRDGNEPPTGLALTELISPAALFFGTGAGLAWISARGGFSARGSLWKRAARYMAGLVVTVLLFFGMRAAFPTGGELVPLALRYVRYAVVGFWITGGAPWLFDKLRLN